MKLHESFDEFMERRQNDVTDWPSSEEELDELLLENRSSDLGLETHDQRVAAVLEMIGDVQRESGECDIKVEVQSRLWDGEDNVDDSASNDCAQQDDYQIVRDAYLGVYEGFSTDRVVADPDKNCLFVQACWARGIQASQAELNRMLLNARKAKKIGKVEGVIRYRVSRDELDQYLFASEVGLRLLQDKHYFESQKWISLDDVLCEPKLGKEYFELARSITPGFKEVEYRWAALTIRKGMNRGGKPSELADAPTFEELGSRDRIRASGIPRTSGFFWMKSEWANFYIGHNNNLREQMERFFDEGLEEALNCISSYSLFESGPMIYSIAPVPDMPVTKRDPLKRALVNSIEPKFNVTKRGRSAVA